MDVTTPPRRGWVTELVITLVAAGGFVALTSFVIATAATDGPLTAGTVAAVGMLTGLTPTVLFAAAAEVHGLLAERRRWIRRAAR